MKIRAYFKDPDKMPDAVTDAVHESEKPSGVSDEEWKSLKSSRICDCQGDISKKWMPYSEYLMVEFDTEAGTARVLPREEYGE